MNELAVREHGFRELEVYDAESGSIVKRSVEEQRISFALHNALVATELFKGMILKRILDEKRYLDFQCTSFEEYCENMVGMTYRNASRYVRIARRLEPVLPGLTAANMTHVSGALTDGDMTHVSGEDVDVDMTHVSGFGLRHLSELIKLDNEDLKELFSGGEITGADGKTYTLDEIKAMTAREITEKLVVQHNEERKAYKSKIAQLEEKLKLLEKERENLLRQSETLRAIEEKYGPGARKIEEKKIYLGRAYEALENFLVYLEKANLEDEEPRELVDKLQLITNKAHGFLERVLPVYDRIVLINTDGA